MLHTGLGEAPKLLDVCQKTVGQTQLMGYVRMMQLMPVPVGFVVTKVKLPMFPNMASRPRTNVPRVSLDTVTYVGCKVKIAGFR